MTSAYYRQQAARARRLADAVVARPEVVDQLRAVARDYDELAADLENGVDVVRQLLRAHDRSIC